MLPSILSVSDASILKWGFCCKFVNLKELVVLFEEQEPNDSDCTFSVAYSFCRLDLTKFMNGYFSQKNVVFIAFLACQVNLELLKLHSDKMTVFKSQVSLNCFRMLGCALQFLNTEYNLGRLQLNFNNSTDNCEIDVLGHVLHIVFVSQVS